MKRQIEGETWAAPVWTHCMEHEFQLRRDAMKLCREQGYSIQAALWATYRNQEHRMKHWVTLLSIANSRSDGISDKAAREIEQLKKQVAQLQKARSRSPRGAQGSGKKFRGQLALQDYSASSSGKGKGGRGNGHKHNKTRPDFCFPFQSKSCTRHNCRQHHNCAGCDKACLTSEWTPRHKVIRTHRLPTS